jgi:hypothetical protein
MTPLEFLKVIACMDRSFMERSALVIGHELWRLLLIDQEVAQMLGPMSRLARDALNAGAAEMQIFGMPVTRDSALAPKSWKLVPR